MFVKHIALVSYTDSVTLNHLTLIAAALQKQITRDFTPIWNIKATVAAFNSLKDVPCDYWPIVIADDVSTDCNGIHLSRMGIPFAVVYANERLTITCSHEMLEMIVDPMGDQFIAGPSLMSDQGRVNYLVEICDACCHVTYTINDILVSDFCTPDFYSAEGASGGRYSFLGSIPAPRTILKHGYISWIIPESGEWWQQSFQGTTRTSVRFDQVPREDGRSWREMIDILTRSSLQPIPKTEPKLYANKPSFLGSMDIATEIEYLIKKH